MAFGKKKDPAEAKAPKEKKPKKEKAPKKEKPPKKPKPAKKEKPPKKPKPAKKAKPPKKEKAPKKPKKGQEPPQEGEELEEGQKKKPIILLLIPVVVIAVAAAVFFLVIFPRIGGGPDEPDVIETEEPLPPELPEQLMVGDISVPGMTLESDESGAQAVLAKTITYTYTDLNNAGAAAKTYADQLKSASPGFSIVDEDFVRVTEDPDFTTAEGKVILARNLSKAEIEAEFGTEEAEETPEPTDPPEDESDEGEDSAMTGGLAQIAKDLLKPGSEVEGTDPPGDEGGEPESPAPEETPEPVKEPPSYVISVRITWSEGQCVVTADEEEGKVTSPQQAGAPGTPSISIRDAEAQLLSMTPAELGLPGTSMSQYEVFWQEGTELVNDVTCIRLDVYNSSDGPNPYLFASSYLMSVNGAHLYKLDPITDELQELDFTLNVG